MVLTAARSLLSLGARFALEKRHGPLLCARVREILDTGPRMLPVNPSRTRPQPGGNHMSSALRGPCSPPSILFFNHLRIGLVNPGQNNAIRTGGLGYHVREISPPCQVA